MRRVLILRQPRSIYWLKYMALDMEERGYQSYAWWRVGDAISRPALAILATSIVIPAYWLATAMPVGLTRGLAIGVSVGAALGLLRGYEVSVRQALLTAPVVWVEVFAIGIFTFSTPQAIADATEISFSVALSLFAKESLVNSRIRAVCSVILIALSTAMAVQGIKYLTSFSDPNRGFINIGIAVLLGISVASVSARLLITTPTKMQASRIRITTTERVTSPVRPIASAILAASLIGAAGAIGGGLRFGQAYGVSLLIFFGLTIGVPVGIVGGIVKWLSLPIAEGSEAQGASTRTVEGAPLSSDRLVAISSIVGLSAAATASIAIFDFFLAGVRQNIEAFNPRSFELNPF